MKKKIIISLVLVIIMLLININNVYAKAQINCGTEGNNVYVKVIDIENNKEITGEKAGKEINAFLRYMQNKIESKPDKINRVDAERVAYIYQADSQGKLSSYIGWSEGVNSELYDKILEFNNKGKIDDSKKSEYDTKEKESIDDKYKPTDGNISKTEIEDAWNKKYKYWDVSYWRVYESTLKQIKEANGGKIVFKDSDKDGKLLYEVYLAYNEKIQAMLTYKEEKENVKENFTLGEIISKADNFINRGSDTEIDPENMKNMSNTLYNILFTMGIIVAFIVGGILGIKFITEGVEGKAQVKEMLVPYIVGCVVLFGSFTIWKVILIVLQ